jgi:hypothetical protein
MSIISTCHKSSSEKQTKLTSVGFKVYTVTLVHIGTTTQKPERSLSKTAANLFANKVKTGRAVDFR